MIYSGDSKGYTDWQLGCESDDMYVFYDECLTEEQFYQRAEEEGIEF